MRMGKCAVLFRALADETRLRLVNLILESDQPVCVCELADALSSPCSNVSKHLGILRQAGLVVGVRTGTWVSYERAPSSPMLDDLIGFLRKWLTGPPFERDRERLNLRFGLREEGQCVLGPGDPRVEAALSGAAPPGASRQSRASPPSQSTRT